jgi:plastocyanin
MHQRLRQLTALAALAVLATGACSDDDDPGGGDAQPAGGGTTVTVDDNVFSPDELTVSEGDTVTWEWVGDEPHNVVGDDFESELQTEGTFEHRFDEAGTYDYLCQVHPGMEGAVEVTA